MASLSDLELDSILYDSAWFDASRRLAQAMPVARCHLPATLPAVLVHQPKVWAAVFMVIVVSSEP